MIAQYIGDFCLTNRWRNRPAGICASMLLDDTTSKSHSFISENVTCCSCLFQIRGVFGCLDRELRRTGRISFNSWHQ